MFHGKSQQLQIGNKTAPGFDMVIFDTAPTGALAQIPSHFSVGMNPTELEVIL